MGKKLQRTGTELRMTAEEKMKKAAIIGGGTVGGGWAARFLLNGWDVDLYDPDPEALRKLNDGMVSARQALPQLTTAPLPQEGRIRHVSSLTEAAKGASYIQESLPERLEMKQALYKELQAVCAPDIPIGSSTSGFRPSELGAGALNPEQIIVAHPYVPAYLLPVVELVGSPDAGAFIAKAEAVFRAVGMKPVVINQEIDAHIGDRLLEAVWREALWLIKDDITTTEQLDDIITHGFGLRWAQMGLFETYRIGGGEAGMRHFISQFAPALKWPWSRLTDVPELDDGLIDKIAAQSDAHSGALGIRELEAVRDGNLVSFLQGLKARNWGAGQVLNEWEKDLFARHAETREQRLASACAQAPLRGFSCHVQPDWLDYNGHMTEFRYLQVASLATDYLLELVGLDETYLASGHSFYTVETHLRHLAEAQLGEVIEVSTQVILAEGKKLHLFHELAVADEAGPRRVATAEHMIVHVDTAQGRAVPLTGALADNLARLSASHEHLPLPEDGGRAIKSK